MLSQSRSPFHRTPFPGVQLPIERDGDSSFTCITTLSPRKLLWVSPLCISSIKNQTLVDFFHNNYHVIITSQKTYRKKGKTCDLTSHPTSLATSLPIPWSLRRSHIFTSDWGRLESSPTIFCNQWFFFEKKRSETKRVPLVQWFFGKGGGRKLKTFKYSNLETFSTKEPLKCNKWRVPPFIILRFIASNQKVTCSACSP